MARIATLVAKDFEDPARTALENAGHQVDLIGTRSDAEALLISDGYSRPIISG